MSKLLLKKKFTHGGVRVFNDRPPFEFIEVQQIHCAIVEEASSCQAKELKEADGLYFLFSKPPEVPLAIKTADCLPITLIGKNGVAHIHAGWRGLNLGIQDHEMVKAIEPFYAFIGPSIHQESYEVSDDFRDNFPGLEECFNRNNERLTFNLPLAAKLSLQQIFPKIEVELSSLDTFTTPSHNSFRKTKTKQRNYNVLYPEAIWE
jgi:copper oxidase (laccase) domain-containing protein